MRSGSRSISSAGLSFCPTARQAREPIYLNAAALAVLADLPRLEGNRMSFPREKRRRAARGFGPAMGRLSRRPPGSTGCAFTIFATASPLLAPGAASACLSSGNCSGTLNPRRRRAMRILPTIRCGKPSKRSARRSRRQCPESLAPRSCQSRERNDGAKIVSLNARG